MAAQRELPPYAFVPGGPWPHPVRDPRGHSFREGPEDARPAALDPAAWRDSGDYLWGFRLFDAGYYWEAHEVWEGLWHAARRRGPVADLLKALIKLAAAGVKVREGQPHGVATHARRAAALIAAVQTEVGSPRFLGCDLKALRLGAEALVANPVREAGPREAPVCRVFDRDLSEVLKD